MRALVLSGGVAELVEADQISGASAGACVAAQIATGARAEAIERQRQTASVEAIGDNPLDPVHRRPALEAGIAQAADELAAVREFWA